MMSSPVSPSGTWLPSPLMMRQSISGTTGPMEPVRVLSHGFIVTTGEASERP